MESIPEWWLDAIEEENKESLVAQKRRSEQEFREGRTVTWEEVKRRNGLDTDTEPRP